MIDVEGVKIMLKVGGAKHILTNILEIIEDTVFVKIVEISIFLTTNSFCKTIYYFIFIFIFS